MNTFARIHSIAELIASSETNYYYNTIHISCTNTLLSQYYSISKHQEVKVL